MAENRKNEDGEPIQETSAEFERRVKQDYTRWEPLQRTARVAEFRILFRDPARDSSDTKFYELLDRSTGVWMPAANQESLPNQFAKNYPKVTERFQVALRNVVARGGVVGGLGGGMGSLPETIIAGSAESDGGWDRAELRFGLALFTGAIVDQNFDVWAGRLERLTDVLRNGPRLDRLAGVAGVERRTIGLGVDRNTAMILRGSTIRVLGEGRGHVFLKSNGDRTITWRTLEAGDDPITVVPGTTRRRQSKSDGNNPGDSEFNPFGLPVAQTPSRPGTVVLHGGGDTDEMINLYPDLAGIPRPRLVHCPAARESCRPGPENQGDRLAEHLEATFAEWRALQTEGRLDSLTFVTSNNPFDANRPEFVRPLQQANALWFCGGDQRPLAELFVDRGRPTLFQKEVLNLVARGGVVGGSSAGLAIMSDVMIEGSDSDEGGPAIARLSRGLGVLKHVLAEQHFDARGGRIERLTNLLRDHKRLANFSPTCRPRKMIGIAVEEDTALIIRENRMRVSGKKLVHVFLQSADPRVVTWHALVSGDHAILRQKGDEFEFELQLEDWEFRE